MLSNKAQTSLEVLLILAAAVLIAAAIGFYLKTISKEKIAEQLNQIQNNTVQHMQEV